MTGQLYKVFSRSARNFDQFASARKRTIETGLTYEEAQRTCRNFNDNRTPTQIRRGTKYEFTAQ